MAKYAEEELSFAGLQKRLESGERKEEESFANMLPDAILMCLDLPARVTQVRKIHYIKFQIY